MSETSGVCVVTGAAGGIGKAVAVGLARAGLAVVAVDRDPDVTDAAVAEIRRETGSESVEAVAADLSRQAEVRELAAELNRRYPKVSVLVNNAGVVRRRRTETVDGLEMTWAVNYLAPFLLTNLLADALAAGTPGRVVMMTSDTQALGRVHLDDTQFTRRRYRSVGAYQQSKIAGMVFTVELAHRWKATGVTVNAVHPGLVRTTLGHDLGPMSRLFERWNPMARTQEQGAGTPLYLATSTEVADVTGGYFVERKARPDRINRQAKDPAIRTQLWELSAE
jgi:NAD(P)-dependent dehydrogenase (short-subunit alcohol dehydrogenase family)